ncbi:MAG: hypothetical protein ACKN9K_09375, partial [Dolichospermum sp.]
AVDAGNPMMDGLNPNFSRLGLDRGHTQDKEQIRPLIITLLPGSRAPEAYNNWEMIMVSVSTLVASLQPANSFCEAGTMIFLGAIAPGLDCGILSQSLHIQGWRLCDQSPL